MNGYIYVVEDDESIQTLLSLTLKTLEYEILAFDNGEAMLKECGNHIPSLIFLDVMLPGDDGFTILRKLKSHEEYKTIPVLFLTAKSDETDKVTGLESGAEDYLTKPFSVLELLSRTKKVLLRNQPRTKDHILTYKDITIFQDMFEVKKDGIPIDLTMKEYRLFVMLIENKGRVVMRNELLDKIWGINFEGETRTLDMHIKTLRSKLHDDAENPTYIKTIRGAGYTVV